MPDFIVNQMNVQGVFHHPTFLYESLWNLVGIVILLILRRQKFLRAGELFIGYFIWYSIGRFFIEAVRTDSLAFQGAAGLADFINNALWAPMTWMGFELGHLDPAYGNIRISQLLSVLIVIGGIVLIIVRRVTGRANVRYLDPIVSTKTGAGPTPEADLQTNKAAKSSAQAPVKQDKPAAEPAETADKSSLTQVQEPEVKPSPVEDTPAINPDTEDKRSSCSMIETVLFDLDGTIIDTNELIISSFLHVFEAQTPGPLTREQIIPHMGTTLEQQLRAFSGALRTLVRLSKHTAPSTRFIMMRWLDRSPCK